MDWYPLWNSLRIAAISTVIIFFAGIFAAYYIAKLPRLIKGVLDVVLTLPLVLPPTVVDGRALYDGGIGRGGGIMVPRAMDDGLSRFFVVCTRPRGFRRPLKPNRFYDAFFWRRPRMREALDTWKRRYDAELDRLDRLEAEGRAYVFYANDQGVKNTERDAEKLARNYERGRMQALSEFDKWERFLSGQGV